MSKIHLKYIAKGFKITTIPYNTNDLNFTILFVDDNSLTRKNSTMLLKKFSNQIFTASNGEDALQLFKEHTIHLIITDIIMPKLNGLKLIKEIRMINPDIPILILSAHQDSDFLHQSINLDIQGYILKPLNITLLQQHINKIKKKYQDAYLLKQYQEITDNSSIISKTDTQGIITYVNENFCQFLGYKEEELIGKPHYSIESTETSFQEYTSILFTLKKRKDTWKGILEQKNKQGKILYLQTTIKPLFNEKGEIHEFITLSVPITKIHPYKELSDYLQSLESALVILIKIDEFKYLNNSLTSKITKRLQKKFAQELLNHMPSKCKLSKVYLLDNGEFAFVKSSEAKTLTFISKIQNFQKRVNNAKIKIGHLNYTLSIIISVASGKNALENAKIGLRKLLENKQEFIVASNLLQIEKENARQKLKIFTMVKDALDSKNIVSYFQPIINNKTQKIEKYESLVRLIDTQKNILSPYYFLETAKEGKYYKKITSIVLKNSFTALYKITQNISINLSALDIEQKETQAEFFSLLEKHKKEAHRIVVELLEDESINNAQTIKKFVKEIRKYGVQVAIDDFGTGLSNFSRVLEYQPDFIKIDGTLIQNIEHDDFSRNMVETIVLFAKKQNIKTIAEYVENKNIFHILCHLGIDYSQGYYFGKAKIL